MTKHPMLIQDIVRCSWIRDSTKYRDYWRYQKHFSVHSFIRVHHSSHFHYSWIKFFKYYLETALHPLLKRANSRSEYVKNWRDRHIRNDGSATEPGKDAVHFVRLLKKKTILPRRKQNSRLCIYNNKFLFLIPSRY